MRIAMLALLTVSFGVCDADDWTPPKNPDPSAILQEAKADTRAGRYEIALSKHLWYHENALTLQPSQSGVRLSFALSNWLELGESYPPALEKLKQIRDDTEKKIRDEDRIRVRFTDYHDFVALNRTLRDEQRTAHLFKWLDTDDAEDAKRMFNVSQPALIRHEAFELYGKYMDAERDVSRIRESYTMGVDLAKSRFGERHREFTEKKYLNDATTLVAVLAKLDRQAEAEDIAERLREFISDPPLLKKLNDQLEPALTGIVPTPWP